MVNQEDIYVFHVILCLHPADACCSGTHLVFQAQGFRQGCQLALRVLHDVLKGHIPLSKRLLVIGM